MTLMHLFAGKEWRSGDGPFLYLLHNMQQHRYHKRRYWYVQRYSQRRIKLRFVNELYHIDIACDKHNYYTYHILRQKTSPVTNFIFTDS
jgi:hypothetical protein